MHRYIILISKTPVVCVTISNGSKTPVVCVTISNGRKTTTISRMAYKCFSGVHATPSLVLCVGFSGVRATPSLVLCVGFSGVHATRSLVLCVGFSGVRATPYLVLCVGFLDRCLSFCLFFFLPLCCLFFFYLWILITPFVSFGHCVVCFSSIYGFWLPLSYLLAIVLYVFLLFTDSDYPFGIFWPLCCMFFFYLWILITPLVSFCHCVVCFSSIYGFWLLLWYRLAIVLYVFLLFTDSDYPFGRVVKPKIEMLINHPIIV